MLGARFVMSARAIPRPRLRVAQVGWLFVRGGSFRVRTYIVFMTWVFFFDVIYLQTRY